MPLFEIRKINEADGEVVLETRFGEPATNRELVPAALAALAALELRGGCGVKFNGPASLPVAMALSHAVAHLFGGVIHSRCLVAAVVVCVSHRNSPQCVTRSWITCRAKAVGERRMRSRKRLPRCAVRRKRVPTFFSGVSYFLRAFTMRLCGRAKHVA